LENLDTEVDINKAWETTSIRENIKSSAKESLGYYELRNRPWRFKFFPVLHLRQKETGRKYSRRVGEREELWEM
jgi:hypothetical protein